jgi:hypothetical protein
MGIPSVSTKTTDDRSFWGPAHYAVFVLPSKQPKNVLMIDLGEAEPIDKKIAAFEMFITGQAEGSRHLAALMDNPSKGQNVSRTNLGYLLGAAVFNRLLYVIGDRKQLMAI